MEDNFFEKNFLYLTNVSNIQGSPSFSLNSNSKKENILYQRISSSILSLILPNYLNITQESYRFLVCGPRKFNSDVERYIKELGYDRDDEETDNIFFFWEEYGPFHFQINQSNVPSVHLTSWVSVINKNIDLFSGPKELLLEVLIKANHRSNRPSCNR